MPVNVEEFIQIKIFIKSEKFYQDLNGIKTDIEKLKLMFEAIDKYHIVYDEYIFRIYFEACLWMYKIKVLPFSSSSSSHSPLPSNIFLGHAYNNEKEANRN